MGFVIALMRTQSRKKCFLSLNIYVEYNKKKTIEAAMENKISENVWRN
jgi:hypothetical protein